MDSRKILDYNATEETKTFLVQVNSSDNATWQGEVTWMERKKTQRFRSALEMLEMLENAVSGQREELPPAWSTAENAEAEPE